MKGLKYIAAFMAALLLTITVAAQSRAYAKFNSAGETIALFNLTESADGCRERQVMTGMVKNVISVKRRVDITFSFLLDTGDNRRVIVFTLERDAIPSADIQSLISSKRQVTVDTCRRGGRWVAFEIARVRTGNLSSVADREPITAFEPDH